MPRAKVKKKGKLTRIIPPVKGTPIEGSSTIAQFDRDLTRKELNFLKKRMNSILKKKEGGRSHV